MKNLRLSSTIAVIFALAATVAAQTESLPPGDILPAGVSKARCAYTPADETCVANSSDSAVPEAIDRNTLAQGPPRVPGPRRYPRRPAMAYPRLVYPTWNPQVSGRHAAIGALVGLTVGVLAGSRSSAKDALALGTFSAGLGAVFGLLVPAYPASAYRPWPGDNDEEAFRRKPNQPTSGAPERVAASVSRSPEAEPDSDALALPNGSSR